ncbi:MAG: hypothetical protein EAZ76_03505 [Nostocales cyanobacterium]|nr:MAG: hypothetical protein EAZ87_09130 [Nostocales cyanobacterium]TAF19291.1 MAG: hypothetical protein EAZ76_03505 [Nostocales cyanobacterium]
MVKKRLTDLLQEETQKFTPLTDESTIEVTAEKVIESDVSTDEEMTTKTTSTKSKTPTKADLENTIQELQENLAQYQSQETELKQEITDLKTALSEQKHLAEKLAKELYETKKTALHLAESNSQLIAEMKELKEKPAPEPVKETPKPPVQESSKSSKSLVINPHKQYRPAPRVVVKENTTNDDFKDKSWLL